MSENLIPTPSGRRAAATWVTATGVMLLLAAATLFVAVRWAEIPDGAKLGALGLITVGALLAGRAMRPTLPATGDVVFHLGALLLPLDLAAAAVRAGVDWRWFLLSEGVVNAVVFAVLAVATGSIVLRSSAWLAVPVAAAGVAALTPVPAALVLAVVAVAGFALAELQVVPARRARAAALGWAGLAATAPLLGSAAALLEGADGFRVGIGTLDDLGLAGRAFALAALPVALLSAVVLGIEADRRRDLRLAFATLVAILVGAGTAVTGSHVGPGVGLVAIAGAFATLELAALMVAGDRFWSAPLRRVAVAAEFLAAPAAVLSASALALAPFLPDGPAPGFGSFIADRSAGAALALLALGWLTADVRGVASHGVPLLRSLARGSGRGDFTGLVVAPTLAAVLVGGGSSMALAVALLVCAIATIAAGRAGSLPIAAVLVPFAAVCAAGSPLAAVLVGLGGAIGLAWCARRDDVARARLTGVSATTTLLVAGVVAGSTWSVAWVTAATTIALWALAELLDRRRAGAGFVARVAAALPVYVAITMLEPAAMLGTVVVATLRSTLDAVRLSRPPMLLAPALLVQIAIYDSATLLGLSAANTGLVLCVAAFLWAALTVSAPVEWKLPGAAASAMGVALGLGLASTDPATLASAVMIVGAGLLFAGLITDRAALAHAGGAITTLGLFGHLRLAGLDVSEWYLTPVGVQLLFAGWQLRRAQRVSSWVAYAPAIVLLGGVAFVERVAGGAAGHALYAGGVGAAAVAVGGWRRLSAPLVVGTGLLVAVSVHESLSSLAGVATWMWFAIGGAALVAVGVALERHDQGPVEAGRRLVEVLGEHFG